ncbi:Aste57867_9245 [Aphanomyces stellatus]|uniref:Aste57867_9245 protein n=1 Tax=Aphanomyces stellatus TaxID=120398 RepID=A0A485KMG9_9STRA|nr:hypothetical protein As57867_009209 [Aphanomyces stellatus]VFT86128.1 Aste57867_9245 [Aphanomyces stellatus]
MAPVDHKDAVQMRSYVACDATSLEERPLLQKTTSFIHDRDAAVGHFCRVIGFNELKPLVLLAIPLVLSSALDHVSSAVPIMMMGHISTSLSKAYISAIAMGMAFLLLTGWTVIGGNGSAMDTLCSQSYGAGQKKDLGLVFQAGWMAGNLLLVPVLCLSIFCKDILLLFGQTDEVSALASNLVLLMVPAMPLFLFYDLLRRVLQSQNIVMPLMGVSAVCVFANLTINYGLMFHTSLGYLGRAVASSIMALLTPLFLWPYLSHSDVYRQEWKGWDLHTAWTLVPEILQLGMAGAAMVGFEMLSFSIASIVAGMLPNAEVAISADVCMHGFRGFFYMLYGPVAVAGSVRVGNALGCVIVAHVPSMFIHPCSANDPDRARLAAWQCIGLCGALGFVGAILMVSFRHSFPTFYTRDAAIVDLSAQLLLVCAPFQTAVGVYVGIMGIFRGSGQQTRGAILNGVTNVLVGLPLGLALAYAFSNGIVGLWIGISVAILVCAIYGVVWLARVDWDALAYDAQVRTIETHAVAVDADAHHM